MADEPQRCYQCCPDDFDDYDAYNDFDYSEAPELCEKHWRVIRELLLYADLADLANSEHEGKTLVLTETRAEVRKRLFPWKFCLRCGDEISQIGYHDHRVCKRCRGD